MILVTKNSDQTRVCVCVCFVSKAIYYFIPSLVAIVRGITSLMRIGFFLYYNCDLICLSGYTDIIPNTV